jgi:DNA-binding transcriptional regulator YhcF (GntR family)
MFEEREDVPVYIRLAGQIADEVLLGRYPEGELLPSTTEFAEELHINPATAAHALNMLHNEGIIEKLRGIGTAVSPGATERIRHQRRQTFIKRYVQPMVSESQAIQISVEDVMSMVRRAAEPSRSDG